MGQLVEMIKDFINSENIYPIRILFNISEFNYLNGYFNDSKKRY